ncbi:hypothetical protein [Anabaena azotica]|uniref:Uncharacterized protein n=1 Tax=Anabaena azotica FACHB-119 TaxID=947527 RepID=A0ABR8DD35_9NOST|nr:hypothetical protein [Anabaena azotica]MBD2505112.1 hypothetical protein [Anabaena azotica FACHB-119]HLO85060.1 hypothetical protein [Nostocaceae cyanobacterium]
MELNLLQKEELIETLACEFYLIQGYQIPPDYRMQSSTHPVEKSCVAMALFAIQKLQSLDCVVEEETDKLTDTQKVINWFRKLWRRGDKDQIKERVQDYIINVYYIEESEADKLGQWTWEDFSSFENIIQNYPLPEINTSLVDWKSVGIFIHDLFDVRFHEDDY